MSNSVQHWEHLYRQMPLCEAPHHFANMRNSPFTMQYLTTVFKHCTPTGRTCEMGIGTGHAAIAQQVALADWVVFSVPSVYYPFEPEFGDERLLPLEEWEHLLSPFAVEELRYYGDPQHGEREHILCVLRGQEMTDDLRARM